MSVTNTVETNPKPVLPEWAKLVQGAVDSLNFGVVQIVVQDRKVIQIEKKEKLRLDPNA